MYDIRQFKPALYVLLLLGITGFALAALSPIVWVFGAGGIALNGYLVWRGSFRPMPRVISNLITIAALVLVIREIFGSGGTPVLVIGQFLVLLQVVKAWEQRGNRDSAQLLVLSLLLMVAAAINTASLLFGILLVIYLFLSLYCCLLFHLKVETDNAKSAMALPEEKLSPATLRQDQRYLTRSMRRLTGLVSAVSIIFAIVVFVLFPRGTGAGVLGPIQLHAAQSLVGFGEEVNFQSIARIQQNNAVVAQVGLTHNGVPVRGERILLLRGLTYDQYTGAGRRGGGPWRWLRTEPGVGGEVSPPTIERDTTFDLVGDPQSIPPERRWVQHVRLHPTGTSVLFAMGGPVSIHPMRSMKLRFSPHDGVLQGVDLPPGETIYQVTSTDNLGNADPLPTGGTAPENIDPKITAYTRQPDVSGRDAQGQLLVDLRNKEGRPDALDEQIAASIEQHLKSKFAYTLDLTDTRTIQGRDPLVAFLYDFKKGHCEYFAGAMTLMCQSVGLRARMVAGFHCEEYNGTPGADFYTVRQSHAHTWVEVQTPSGWRTFDPTSERDAAEQQRRAGTLQRVRHFFDFLEYTYANAVIAYTNEDRQNLIQNTETVLLNTAMSSTNRMDRWRRMPFKWGENAFFLKLSSAVIFAAIALIGATILAVIAHFAWQRWRLRRRAERIGIGALPESERLRLARQLGFYDDLLKLLGRHQIARPGNLTPLEFSRSLLFLPADAYETVRRLTELFYRIRYGRTELTPTRQRWVSNAVARLEGAMDVPGR